MRVTEVPARDARPLIAEVHADLVALLASLREAEWAAPTEAGRWALGEGTARSPAAALRMPAHLAWRQLTGLPVPAGGYRTEGDERLAAPLLAVRGIIV
jgi:hypothetical protein